MTRVCECCGGPLKVSQKLFCSPSCAYAGRAKRKCGKQVVCAQCGEGFVSTVNQKFCSSECRDKSRLVARVCVTCGVGFMGRPWQINCSRECKGKARGVINRERARKAAEARALKPRKVSMSEVELFSKLDRVVLGAYERGDVWERARIRALNPGLFGGMGGCEDVGMVGLVEVRG